MPERNLLALLSGKAAGTLIYIVGAVAISAGYATAALAQDSRVTTEKGKECQPGRCQSARELLAEGKDFKLNATQSSVSMKDAIRDAHNMNSQARKLNSGLKLQPGALDQYKKDLAAFASHVSAYKAHLAQVEKDLGHCSSNEKLYAEHMRKYGLHTNKFHMPDVPPPAICEELVLSEAENARLANQLKQDRERLARVEMELADSEAQLRDSIKQNKHADDALRNRSRLAEEERRLSGEFASLKTEYDLLDTQHSALKNGGVAPGALGIGSVAGKVRGSK